MRRTILTALPTALVVGGCASPDPCPARAVASATLDGSSEARLGSGAGADEPDRTASSDRAVVGGDTFDAAWSTVRDTHFDPAHLDPARGGVDWIAVRDELRPKAVAARDVDELREVLDELLARLGQSHFEIVAASRSDSAPTDGTARSPQAVPALGAGSGLDGSCGLELRVIDGRAVVYDLVPMLSASREGVGRGWEVVSVDGEAMAEVLGEASATAKGSSRGSVLARAAGAVFDGPVGARRAVEFLDGSGVAVQRTLQLGTAPGEPAAMGDLPEFRVRFAARLATDQELAATGGGGPRIGIVAFNIWMPPVIRLFHEAIDRFRDADGLVIDLRGNPGGAGFLATSVAGYLVREPMSLGDLRTRTERWRFDVRPRYMTATGGIAEPFAGPVAVLVDELTASTSEIFAGGLRAADRVRLFGQTTAGATLPARTTRLPSGDTLLHATADYTLPDGTRLEGVGLSPDEAVALRREDLLAGRDATLAVALRWIAARSPDAATAPDPIQQRFDTALTRSTP